VALDRLFEGEAAVVAGEDDGAGRGRGDGHRGVGGSAPRTVVEAPGNVKVGPGAVLDPLARPDYPGPVNPQRRPFIAGNWKMNAGGPDAAPLAAAVARAAQAASRVDVLVAPPFTALAAVAHG
jgi:hypothetical protein